MIDGLLQMFRPLATPLGLLWLILLAGTAVSFKKKVRKTAVFLLTLAALMSLIGGRFSLSLVEQLEKPYFGAKVETVAPADAVVMLGGVVEFSRNDPLGFNLSSSGDRALVAVELIRQGQGGALVLGGGGAPGKDELDETQALGRWITGWKLNTAPVHLLGVCRNTRDEAEKVSELAKKHGWRKIILVTSATHMNRALAVFRTLNLDVVPVACDFHKLGTPYEGGYSPIPTVNGFRYLEIYLHEKIGWLVYRRRGWISEEAGKT